MEAKVTFNNNVSQNCWGGFYRLLFFAASHSMNLSRPCKYCILSSRKHCIIRQIDFGFALCCCFSFCQINHNILFWSDNLETNVVGFIELVRVGNQILINCGKAVVSTDPRRSKKLREEKWFFSTVHTLHFWPRIRSIEHLLTCEIFGPAFVYNKPL